MHIALRHIAILTFLLAVCFGAMASPRDLGVADTSPIADPAQPSTGHRFVLINDGTGPITFVAFTPTGIDRWFSVEGGPIEPGVAGEAILSLPGSACVFDFRVRYGQRAPKTIKAWNACDKPVLHVGQHDPS